MENPLTVEGISVEEVKTALRSTEALRWLTARDETIPTLTNLRALGWVIQASTAIQAERAGLTSLAAIADRIWEFWTEGKAAPQNLLIRLSVREAEFERSFALSEMDAADAAIFQNRPRHLPLRKNSRNRIEFEHDLAADWARFQRLKEVVHDVDQWSALVTNPLWSGAIRLLGQFLLREPTGSSLTWDTAFSTLEKRGATLVVDALLDALFLDPQAAIFLEDRAELLFANKGDRLNRLLRRFLHIATVANAPQALRGVDRAVALYLEDKYRTPVVGLWPAIANFLHAHLLQVSDLISPVVATVCEAWLTATPQQLRSGAPTPFRKGFAEIALASARALQVDQGKGTIYLGDGEQPIYSAALAGASDLPDEVGAWALEMAQRRPADAEVAKKIAEAKAKAAAEHAERLRTDAKFRARQKELAKRRSIEPPFFPSPQKLPPWPMGPKKRVEQNFQQVCLHSPALGPLMRVRPELAAEILLALLIEGDPVDERSRSMLDEKLGLDHDTGNSYPTIFWKSQFLSFLQVAPDVALTTLICLVNFCTERWVHERTQDDGGAPHQTTLTMRDGSEKTYIGNGRVFNWTQDNSNFNGQLHCALNALERWLTLKIEHGENVEPYLKRLLQESSSIAFIGLLVNVAKYRPAFLSDVLMPLLSSDDGFWFDRQRVRNAPDYFDQFAWSRAGETIFNLARDWTLAPYRQRNLVQVVGDLIPRNKAITSFLKTAVGNWDKPSEPKLALESRMLCADLDEMNYRIHLDAETGAETIEFEYPEALRLEVAAYQQAAMSKVQDILLPGQCERILQGSAQLSDADAQILADVLSASPIIDDDDDKGRQACNKLAAAVTLIIHAKNWLALRSEVNQAAKSALRAKVENIGEAAEELHRLRFANSDVGMKFAAYGVFHLWLQGDETGEWERYLLRLLTSGDERTTKIIGILAHRHQTELGARWWRLLQLGAFWSTLSMLGPRHGDPQDIEVRWKRWVQWLRSRRISGVPSSQASVDFLDVWQRLKRLERDRWRRAAVRDSSSFRLSPEERPSRGLDTGFLANLFDWLLADASRPKGEDLEVGRKVLLKLWAYEAAYCSERRNDRGEYRLPDQFGYDVLAKLAFYTAHVPAENVPEIWRSVLSLGSSARPMIEHFIGSWFLELYRGCDPTKFCTRWRDMIEFALDAKWVEGRHWFDGQRMLRKLLGFDSELFLTNLPDPAQAVLSMRDLYQRWAEANLAREEENVGAFSYFLASKAGAALRIDGLEWLAVTFKDGGREQYWRDRVGTGDALVNLLDIALTEDAPVLVKDREAREALVALAAYAAARQVPAALALQERIKHLK